jgi:hypothetical protein
MLAMDIPEGSMRKVVSMGDAVARWLLLPGDMVCSALELSGSDNLLSMLVNSLIWTLLGVVVVWMVT